MKKHLNKDTIKNKLKSQRARIIIVCLVLIIVGATISWLRVRNSDGLDVAKIEKFESINNCEKTQSATKNNQVDPNNPTASIALLRFRSTCYIKLASYDDALAALTDLRTLLVKTNDRQAVSLVDSQITDVKYNISQSQSSNQKKPRPPTLEQQKILDEVRAEKP